MIEPAKITAMRTLSGLDLTSKYCNFALFRELTELNLSYNKLTDLTEMGLSALSAPPRR